MARDHSRFLAHLWVETLDVQVGNEEFDGFFVDFILAHLTKLNDVVQEGRVGHARQTIGLEGGLNEIHLLLSDVQLEWFNWQGLRGAQYGRQKTGKQRHSISLDSS